MSEDIPDATVYCQAVLDFFDLIFRFVSMVKSTFVEKKMRMKVRKTSTSIKGEKARLQEFLLHPTPLILHPYSTGTPLVLH